MAATPPTRSWLIIEDGRATHLLSKFFENIAAEVSAIEIEAAGLDALTHKGDFSSSTNGGNYPTGGLGDYYEVSESFTLGAASGSHQLSTGDAIVSNSATAAGVDADWQILRGVAGVTLTAIQTLTNKTLTAPALNSPVLNTSLSGTAFLDEDDMSSNSATKAASQQSIKAHSDSATQTLTNKTTTNLVQNGTATGTAIKDEDTMSSNSATHLATQQSIKAYVDTSGDYTTSEVDTGATWIDSAPIYKKTISFGALPNATTKTVAHGVSFVKVLKQEGFADGPNEIVLPFPTLGGATGGVFMYVDGTNIDITTDTNQTGRNAWITLFYTKT